MRAALLAVSWAVTLQACTSVEEIHHHTEVVADPYAGETPYPNRRPPFARPSELGLVASRGSDTLALIDIGARSVVGSGLVGREPITVDGPVDVASDKSSAFLLLAYPPPSFALGPHAATHTAGRVRPGYVEKVALDDLRPLGEVAVDASPGSIAISDDGSRVVVTHFDLALAAKATNEVDDKRASVMWMPAAAIVPTGAPPPHALSHVCVAPQGLALSPGAGGTAWIACYGEDVLSVVDLEAGAVERIAMSARPTYPGSPVIGPYAVVRSPNAALLAVSNVQSKDVRFFEPATKHLRDPIATGAAPYVSAWTADGTKLYVPLQGPDGLAVIDVTAGSIAQTVPLPGCTKPHGATLSHDERTVFVTCEGDQATPSVVVALSSDTLQTVTTLPVGIYPGRMILSPN